MGWVSCCNANDSDNQGERRDRIRSAANAYDLLNVPVTSDALFSQTNVRVTPNVTNIHNVDAIRTHGIELALQAADVAIIGLNITSSVTWTRSVITANSKFPASVGKWRPRVPDWRANVVATYRANDCWSFTGGLRCSVQCGTLDNSDPNGATYTGVSKFLVADVRERYQATKSSHRIRRYR